MWSDNISFKVHKMGISGLDGDSERLLLQFSDMKRRTESGALDGAKPYEALNQPPGSWGLGGLRWWGSREGSNMTVNSN
eukprot:5783851-Amphidinium_carterae.1